MNPRLKLAYCVGAIVAVNWLLLAVVQPSPKSGPLEEIAIGFFYGSMFAQSTLAAAWAAFGPGTFIMRLACSLAWIMLLPAALPVNISLNGGPTISTGITIAVIIGLCLLGQWMLLQFPLWALAIGYGLHVRHFKDGEGRYEPRERQFGIAQLIAVTTIVGVILGIGRGAIALLDDEFLNSGRQTPILIFLGVASIVVSLPLLIAVLIKKQPLIAIGLALVFMALMTLVELPLLQAIHPGSGAKPNYFIAINVFTAIIIMAVLVMVRWCGFSLSRAERPSMAQQIQPSSETD